MIKIKSFIAIVSIMLFGLSVLPADYRYYVWTYQFMTMPPGMSEIELYTRMTQKDAFAKEAFWKRQVEIELGLTSRSDVGFYIVDEYKPSEEKSVFSETKIRVRYAIAEKDELFVDPILYAEYKMQTDRRIPDLWEWKLILARDIGELNAAVNLIFEEKYDGDSKETKLVSNYALGGSFPIGGSTIRTGAEFKGNFLENKHSAGPSISWKGGRTWAAVGSQYRLTEKADALQVQAIFGFFFGK